MKKLYFCEGGNRRRRQTLFTNNHPVPTGQFMPLFLFLSFFHVLLIRVNMQKKVCSRGAFVVLDRKGKKKKRLRALLDFERFPLLFQ